MKKQIIAVISIACVALCAAVWPRSAKVEELPAEPIKTAVSAEIEARSEKKPYIFISKVIAEPESEPVTESEPQITKVTTEKETKKPAPTPTAASKPQAVSKPAPATAEPKPGDRTVIDGEPHVWIPGFGWIVDEGGGSVGTMVGNPGDQLTGHKVGIMGGGTTVDGKGDINKQVGIMGGGTVAEDMYENGHKTGIMGGDDSAPNSTSPPAYAEPEITGDVIYVPLQPPVTKDSTPPAFKPNGEPYNPRR
jgi:hypothetical protein